MKFLLPIAFMILATGCGTETGKKIFGDTQRTICEDSCSKLEDGDARNACMKRCMYE